MHLYITQATGIYECPRCGHEGVVDSEELSHYCDGSVGIEIEECENCGLSFEEFTSTSELVDWEESEEEEDEE
jgi:transcription elongation factor Elf1